MNDKQRKEIDEAQLALQTASVLESEQCTDQEDAATYELGRLLRQSVTHELPESNDDLREQLLATLASGGDAPSDVSLTIAKAPLKKVPARTVGRRWRAGLATGVLVAIAGWWAYQPYSEGEPMDRQVALNNSYYKNANTFAPLSESKTDVLRPAVADVVKDWKKQGAQSAGMKIGKYPEDFSGPSKQSLVVDEVREVKNRSVRIMNDKLPELVSQLSEGEEIASFRRPLTKGELEAKKSTAVVPRYKSKIAKAEVGQSVSQRGLRLGLPGRAKDLSSLSDFGEERRSKGFVPSGVSFDDGSSKLEISQRGGEGQLSAQGQAIIDRNGRVNFFKDSGVDTYSVQNREIVKKLQEFDRRYTAKYSMGEQYAPIHENAFVQATGGAALSTFSIDVDTASYANMRRFLNSGQTPPRDSIRIEELVNYFQYDYPQPKGDDPFSVNMELANCPWNDSHKLLRVGLKGKEIHVKERPATNVVFLIDVSGSMNSAAKLPLLKRGFQMMVKQLGENDRVSIVTYAGNAGVALEPTSGDNTKTINEAIERLTPGGSTHGSAGINLAYNLAQQHFITGGVNKVILATDGDLNVGVTADGALVDLIKQKASEGVFLTVLGFGTGNLQDGKLEKLADNGNGQYAYIDSNREAHRVLVQQLSGSLVTIAKDVKIQIEFNPAEVKSYRLVGYENRMLETKDFADDRKDAGEIGAGHTVTAIYEIEPTGGVAAAFAAPQGMKYQNSSNENAPPKDDGQNATLSNAADSGELATLALRYKQPDENTSKRIEFTIKNQEKSFTSASDDFRFAASVAGFGMLLRDSAHAGNARPQMILEMASQSMGDDTTGYRAEFVDLIRKAFAK